MPGPGDPPKETQFKPGQSGNPAGRPPEAPAALKNFTKKEIAVVLCRMMKMTVDELVDRHFHHPAQNYRDLFFREVFQGGRSFGRTAGGIAALPWFELCLFWWISWSWHFPVFSLFLSLMVNFGRRSSGAGSLQTGSGR